MKAFILSAYSPPHDFTARWLTESAREDPFAIHELAKSPADADLILFAEGHTAGDPYYLAVRRHLVWRRYRDRCFLYHDEDYVVPLVPGLFPALENWDLDLAHAVGAPYMARLAESPIPGSTVPIGSDALLYSFVGSTATHPVRREVMRLSHDARAHCEDAGEAQSWLLSPKEKEEYFAKFARVMARSRFVLCPRGNSPSTYRLYEAMEMGRAPVIISDAFTPFEGPDWARFSLRVAESEVSSIPLILRANEALSDEMGRVARETWERWVAKPVCFHRTVEAAQDLLAHRRASNGEIPFRYLRKFLTPFHLKNLLRFVLRNRRRLV